MQILIAAVLIACAVVFTLILVAVIRHLWVNRLEPHAFGPPPPCSHRFIRIRYRVVGGVVGEPEPICGDCGQTITTVKIIVKDWV